jgi:hypothetical protein
MTWLPLAETGLPERDAALGLKEEPYAALREVLTHAWRITDADLLELCRLRLAQLVDAEAETADADPHLFRQLERWESSPEFTPEQRAALERFRRWYAAKIVGDLSRGAGVESATPFDQDPEGGG